MAELESFRTAFRALTGFDPMPWQEALYEQFIKDGEDNIPASCSLPTGLGKTLVIAIWLIALANRSGKIPRRLVYVVNRRTVVDQTTDEVEKLCRNLDEKEELKPLRDRLRSLAVSTLRGQFADNREWSADPSRPAVICGTVDMIGSRLLFSGYGVGFKAKPLHAGFLGQDVLLVHDEAHLEPAFQKLLVAIQTEQNRSNEFAKFRVMELSATSRIGGGEVFPSPQEWKKNEKHPVVERRIKAKKGIKFHPAKRDDVAKAIGRMARDRKGSDKAILVFVRTIEDVKTVQQTLTDKKEGVSTDQVQVLTGTLRGLERDRMATEDQVFARFLPEPKVSPKQGTVYLVCTSAGEVGVDISADHMVCDLTTLDSMTQRLGRVNRRGGGSAEVDVVFESDPDAKKVDDDLEQARWKTLEILKRLPKCKWDGGGNRQEASPLELRNLNLSVDDRKAAFAPEPVILPATDILFDSWALTTIRGKLPGRPPVEPYLHGVSEWQPPEVQVAWREEVAVVTGGLLATYHPEDLLDDYPLKPHELLRERSDRVFKHLEAIAQSHADRPAWLLGEQGTVEVSTLGQLADKNKKDRINNRTVLLSPHVGGLLDGLLNGGSPEANDVSDNWYEDKQRTVQRRRRVWNDDEQFDLKTSGMRLIRRIDLPAAENDEDAEARSWHWYVRPRSADDDESKSSRLATTWAHHTRDVETEAKRLADVLLKGHPELHAALGLAARFHDLGKKRAVWQRSVGNDDYPAKAYAKSGRLTDGTVLRPREISNYRHELGSLLDLAAQDEFRALQDKPDTQELILHLIAAHHGRGRPHFPLDEAFDPEFSQEVAERIAVATPCRFARLQRKYGRWGLAYLESLLRAADWAASAEPSKFVEDKA
jgi:CRISPR-associated endonuclease/helicase Cas3